MHCDSHVHMEKGQSICVLGMSLETILALTTFAALAVMFCSVIYEVSEMSSRFMDVLFYLFELFLTYFSFYFNLFPFLLRNTFPVAQW